MHMFSRAHARWAAGVAAAALAASLPLGAASERLDYQALAKIKDQGLDPANSKVMEIASWLTDVNGPRLTGSPNIKKAADWAVQEMKTWGLQNVTEEPWTNRNNFFSHGWQNEKFYMAAVSPQQFPIPGTPTGWTPGTNGLGLLNQGYVETSNVNVVEELVNMIQTQRAYEINSKSIQTSDQMLQRLTQI